MINLKFLELELKKYCLLHVIIYTYISDFFYIKMFQNNGLFQDELNCGFVFLLN